MMINSINRLNILSAKKLWATLSTITFMCYAPAMASLKDVNMDNQEVTSSFLSMNDPNRIPIIELPNLDWLVKKVTSPVSQVVPYAGSRQLLQDIQNKIVQLSQEIVADSEEYINHPKVVFMSSLTADKQSIEYMNSVALQLEKIGSTQIPDGVLQKGTRKKVIINMRIDRQGKLLESSINRSSEIKEIDKAALKIIELAAPFQSLPKSMSEQFDQVNIVRTFFFDGS